jgi:DNA-binding transcriptional MerR regulator
MPVPPVLDAVVDPAQRAANAALASRRYTITELAAEFDLTPRAIRFYEDVGLLAPARAGRNRVYSQRDRTRLKLTLRGKRLGLTLAEIRALVDMYESPADTAPQLQAFAAVLQRHRQQLEQQREDIAATLAEIAHHERRCWALLAPAGLTGPVASPASTASASASSARSAPPEGSTPLRDFPDRRDMHDMHDPAAAERMA